MMTRVHLARDFLSMWKKPSYLTFFLSETYQSVTNNSTWPEINTMSEESIVYRSVGSYILNEWLVDIFILYLILHVHYGIHLY